MKLQGCTSKLRKCKSNLSIVDLVNNHHKGSEGLFLSALCRPNFMNQIIVEKNRKMIFRNLGNKSFWDYLSLYTELLYNILKGISASITIYINTKHYGLEQCNDRVAVAIATKSCKDNRGWACLFLWDAYVIEGMVEEKMRKWSVLIICVINIITKYSYKKNIIICFWKIIIFIITQSIYIKNIIICVINIIIFIIINNIIIINIIICIINIIIFIIIIIIKKN